MLFGRAHSRGEEEAISYEEANKMERSGGEVHTCVCVCVHDFLFSFFYGGCEVGRINIDENE